MVEIDEQEAKEKLQNGLERAAQVKEQTIEAHGYHTPDTESTASSIAVPGRGLATLLPSD